MKWLFLFLVVLAVFYPVMSDEERDYTSRYAELASPVPAGVNVDDLVASLQQASNHPH